ncbi:unnamed protein product, partial [Adineta steineri]
YKDGSISFPLGFNSFATWSVTASGNAAIIYSTENRQLTVNLLCSHHLDELYVAGEYELHRVNFTLSSKCACWNGCISGSVSSLTVYKDGSISFPLGFNSFATWSVTASGNAAIIYSTDTRQLTVNLLCSHQLDELHVAGEYELHRVNFTLSSKCACWNGCISGSVSSLTGTSSGFLFLSLLVLHLFFFCSYM